MLRLQLLGGFRAHAEDGAVASLEKQPRRAALLTYLAVEREVPRERVLAMLWPEVDSDRGRHSLNQAIYYLRRLLGPDWVELRGERCVVADWLETDAHELELAAAAGDDARVLQLYNGPLLAGTSWAATAEFEIWVDQQRAALDRLHRGARRRQLAALQAAGDTAGALRCAEAWCRLDPLEDEAQHAFIALLGGSGHRSEALRQFASYRRLLAEHELRPLDETVALVEQLQHGDAPLPAGAHVTSPAGGYMPPPASHDVAAAAHAMEPDRAMARPAPPTGLPPAWLRSRAGLAGLLAAVFAFNLLETTAETWLAARSPLIQKLRLQTAQAAHWLEGGLAFENHELVNRLAVVGYSASYFILFPLLLAAVGITLAQRGLRQFRTFALAVTFNYAISLPFFLFFPVPERWTWPEAQAVVLSDLWSDRLIDLFRPISGLDNSFPSFHVSLSVLVILLAFVHRLRFRWPTLFLGATVVLATFVLGIHWLPDLFAGAAAGAVSVALALRADRALAATGPAPARSSTAAPTPVRAAHAREVQPT